MSTVGKILIIDDNLIDTELLVSLFKRLPYKTLTAQSFREARFVIEKEKNNIILIFQDLNLPDDPTGISTARWCKDHCAHAPRVIITGYDDLKRRVELADLGAVFFLTKGDKITTLDIQPILNIIDNVEAAYQKGRLSNRSWRTTVCGVFVLIAAVFVYIQTHEIATSVGLAIAAFGFFAARDEQAAKVALRLLQISDNKEK